jgi:hypothetical protein
MNTPLIEAVQEKAEKDSLSSLRLIELGIGQFKVQFSRGLKIPLLRQFLVPTSVLESRIQTSRMPCNPAEHQSPISSIEATRRFQHWTFAPVARAIFGGKVNQSLDRQTAASLLGVTDQGRVIFADPFGGHRTVALCPTGEWVRLHESEVNKYQRL